VYSGVVKGRKGQKVGARAPGRINTLFAHLKLILSRNLNQTMLKNAYVFEKKKKNCKNLLSVGAPV